MSLVRLRPVWMTNHPPSVLWHCWLGHQTCKNRRPYNLYCVGADVKPYSINQSINHYAHHIVWHFLVSIVFEFDRHEYSSQLGSARVLLIDRCITYFCRHCLCCCVYLRLWHCLVCLQPASSTARWFSMQNVSNVFRVFYNVLAYSVGRLYAHLS